MDYIFRLPLVDFDITNQDQIIKNWTWIQRAIEFSSESMYREINDREYLSLNSKIKLKIHKFLLRGRYRATPFGFWAGVGIGKWTDKTISCISTETKLLPYKQNGFNYLKEVQHNILHPYVKNPSLIKLSHAFRFYAYSKTRQYWECKLLERNSILDAVEEYISDHKKIDFGSFVSFFESNDLERIKSIWLSIAETGLLHPLEPTGFKIKNHAGEKKVDLVLKHPIHLSKKIRDRLALIAEEMGALFIPNTNQVLINFKRWFEDQFDDRQVLLSEVIKHPEFSMDRLIPPLDNRKQEKSVPQLEQKRWEGVESIDLSKYFPKVPIPKDLNLDVVFRVIDNDEITVENLVCDRPFVYTGRFSRDPNIGDYLRNMMMPEMMDRKDILFAELLLFESEKANYISATSSFLSKKICLFTPTSDTSTLKGEDIYIGLVGGKFELFDINLEQRIVPVVQHPLNPSQISHPLTRLVWEIAHQSTRKFMVYSEPEFVNPSYIPRIMWKNQVLQGKRWTLHIDNYLSADDLAGYIESQNLPHPLMAGAHDLELLIHWRNYEDLQVLWAELKKRKTLYLFEALWVGKSPFKSGSGEQKYPQIVKNIQVGKQCNPDIPAKNPQINKDQEWVYLQIAMSEQQVGSFLRKYLPRLISELPPTLLPDKWFYLVYPYPYCQIRLRFKICPSLQSEFKNYVIPKLISSNKAFVVKIRDYYPEYHKYSLHSVNISTSLFHMECRMLLGEGLTSPKVLLLENPQYREAVILELWTAMLTAYPLPNALLREFKAYIDLLPMTTLKKIKAAPYPKGVPLISTQFKSRYSEVFQNHLWFSDPEFSTILLSNHFHMLVNRTFPIVARVHEEQLVFWLYKFLSRRIHCREGDAPYLGQADRRH
ncbi:lantibiotic dehydratase [Algoriphagus sp. NG3]|uniref:lantibiotic dehydratase n=1 Tax=Algoriphagus sp. NG3 TaxID=3097546 RepID=UPI002A7F2FA6|nr:lantibiotic dehydratase [Algoriphagus sp. NG3]WPR76039.1 lantibiotic dehydratase [Algoriphagus sp. NG3]